MNTNHHDYCRTNANNYDCNVEFCKRAYNLFNEWSTNLYGKMSQPKVSEFTDVPQAIISKIKSTFLYPDEKPYQPQAETVFKIAKAFNVSTDYLLGIDSTSTISVAGLSEKDSPLIRSIIHHLKENRCFENKRTIFFTEKMVRLLMNPPYKPYRHLCGTDINYWDKVFPWRRGRQPARHAFYCCRCQYQPLPH